MNPGWRGMLAMAHYFLSPEDSEFVRQDRRAPALRLAKTLFWIAAAVMAGIALGQLG